MDDASRRRFLIYRYYLGGSGSMSCDCTDVLRRLDELEELEYSESGLSVENTYCKFNYGWIRWGDIVFLNVEMIPKTTISSSTGNANLDIPAPLLEVSSLSSDRNNASSIGEAILYQNKIFKGIGAKSNGVSYYTSLCYLTDKVGS